MEARSAQVHAPRLVGRGTAMSRLAGGIGGRGPGETKLEIDRRRAQNRITNLEKDIKRLAKQREGRRRRRDRSGVPTVALSATPTRVSRPCCIDGLQGARRGQALCDPGSDDATFALPRRAGACLDRHRRIYSRPPSRSGHGLQGDARGSCTQTCSCMWSTSPPHAGRNEWPPLTRSSKSRCPRQGADRRVQQAGSSPRARDHPSPVQAP